jgi:formylglycine-generating enzyme required for sulfatase activity
VRRLALALVLLLPTALPQRTDPSTGMQFVRILAGDFVMGTPASEPMREAQEVQHRVRIAHDFYLATHEVTEREWTLVMGRHPSSASACEWCPVERISYFDVQAFVARLNATSPWPGFRLPTEAEWEYACRAGAEHVYATGDAIDRHRANIDGTRTLPVGSFRRTDGGCSTCPATCGSGRRTTMPRIRARSGHRRRRSPARKK